MSRHFLLCFHDLSVWNYQSVLPTLRELRDFAGRPFSVLVIPSTEGANSDSISEFQESLVQLKKEGFELALHGFKHKAEFSQGRSYPGLISMALTHNEAEFSGLSEFESSRMLQQSISAWKNLMTAPEQSCSELPAAFVPPTWYSNKYLPRQVMATGMIYEGRSIISTPKGTRYVSPAISFAGMPKFTVNPTVNLGDIFMKLPFGLPRIALHPTDFPELKSHVKHLIRTALGSGRTLTLYNKL